jgi:LPPG:FO 2-phospho-L-lactate transferase
MKIVAFAGGVGGAKLADGLAQLICSKDLTIVVNTGDDFEHLGLYISPDLDTVCYTLAGLANPETGWGRDGDTFHVLEYLHKIGGPTWFRLGDQDLATHIERTRRLKIGQPLSQITHDFCRIWDVQYPIIPMTDQVVKTMVKTVEDGELAFQEYFVHRNCEPKVKGFRFTGIESALPAPGVIDSINQADAVILCPSNPWVSIDPILALPVIRSALKTKCVVAVSPIINGHAVKGPAAKMYAEMGILPSAVAIARHYNKLLSGFVMDASDINLSADITIPFVTTKTLMKTEDDRRRLAEDVLNLIQHL